MTGTVMLLCAVMASLAAGVLAAYGILVGMFRVFRGQTEAVARRKVVALRVAVD